MCRSSSILAVLAVLLCSAPVWAVTTAKVEFNRDVRPILSDKCFRCHGPDTQSRKADLRLDLRETAIADGAVVPGNAERSEVMHRILSTDDDERMPPPKANLHLTPKDIAVLRQWIAQGAEYQPHWAFVPPVSVAPPDVVGTVNMIDAFVFQRLVQEKLEPAPEAARETLLRRVTLDLTGLPPTLAEFDAFLSDISPEAYARAVDRLLASPHYGEHMAVAWLDAARYADTNGYFGDRPRSAWPWRDWVIAAFNANMPFDQFTIEQLAGDMLHERMKAEGERMKSAAQGGKQVHPSSFIPQPSVSLLVATGFCRNSMANDEGGIDDEEFRVEFIVDRLDAVSNTWMGLSVGCAQCHDHKYDPISQREFYQLFAFFNNTPEIGHIKPDVLLPAIPVPSPQDEKEALRLRREREAAELMFKPHDTAMQAQLAALRADDPRLAPPKKIAGTVFVSGLESESAAEGFRLRAMGEKMEHEPGIEPGSTAAKFDGAQHLEIDGDLGLAADKAWSIAVWMKGEELLSCVLSNAQADGDKRGVEIIWLKGALQVNLVHRWGVSAIEVTAEEPLDRQDWNLVVLSYDGSGKASGVKLSANGRDLKLKTNRDSLRGPISHGGTLRLGRRDANLGFYGLLDEVRVLDRVVPAEEAARWFRTTRLRGLLAVPEKARRAKDKALLQDCFIHELADAPMRAAFDAVQLAKSRESEHAKLIPTALVMRENKTPRATHLLTRGQWNAPGETVKPDVPAAFPPMREAKDRLGFARWLVSPENPLTARVIVNRLWQQCFGEGLVRTVNDFGSQGEAPTHPELLDWLAVRFMRSGWDVKAMLRLIVTSATYRQSSGFGVRGSGLDDPDNRLLARGPSFRLSAEALRDQALTVSGLLSPRIGGPSVKPWQPPGVWEAVSYNAEESYVPDTGEGRWRRTLYSYWKRQAPPPATLTFDGPTREKCSVRRARTNTPLQALVLLNDANFTAAADALGTRAAALPGTDAARVAWMFRTVTSRTPDADELHALCGLLARQRAASPWMVVAQTILNLDETITRR